MEKRLQRFAFFLLAILVGAVLGLVIGWQIAPLRSKGATPHSLRQDYKTDFVLMVAEVYHQEGDLVMARVRLGSLGEESPTGYVQEAIAYGGEVGYDPVDLALMLALSEDLKQHQPEER